MRVTAFIVSIGAMLCLVLAAATLDSVAWADCGDEILDPGEECDDGNTSSGDGCDSLCRQEIIADTCSWTVVEGDLNASGSVNSGDIIYLINFVFKSGPEPWPCATHGDLNCSGAVTTGDIIVLVNHIFRSTFLPCDVCWESPMGPGCP
jgi:cysteine-rich repeat protein